MKINLRKILEFFDAKHADNKGHASAVVGMIGEDINASAFRHYLEKAGAIVTILNEPVTQGKLQGVRLDRWICAEIKKEKTLYQCEIKNWSSWAIGGKILKVDANKEKVRSVATYYWNHQYGFLTPDYPNKVTKVLVKMKKPEGYQNINILPLLIYWMPISNDKNSKPFFSVKVGDLNKKLNTKTPFKTLHIFSVSLYFRSLLERGIKQIDVDLPHIEKRIKILNDILN